MWPRRRPPRRPLLPQFIELVVIIGFLVASYYTALWYWDYTAPREAEVPKVVGMTQAEARKVLSAAGLRVALVGRKPSEDIPAEAVLMAEPPPGRRVREGRLIRLTLSSGSRWSVVPDVRDMSVDRARALLRAAKLTVGSEQARYDPDVPVGYVLAQAPEPDQKVPRGTSVDVWVSKGPPPQVEVAAGQPTALGARRTEVDFAVPPGPSLQEVRISVQDQRGERTVYRNFHRPGERVRQTISGEGPEITIRVYLSGLLVQEKKI
jgi:serine/threonine-protein kinase